MEPVTLRAILVPLDGSGTAEWAIPVAAAIARREDARLHLLLVHTPLARTFPDISAVGYLDEWERDQHDEQEAYVRKVAEHLSAAGFDADAETVTGDPVSAIVERASELDLLVLTAHGWAGPERAWLGHVADGVVHHVRRPVLIVRPGSDRSPDPLVPELPGFQRILVATDGSPAAREAERHGAHMARLFDADLTLFRAVRFPSGPSSPYIPHAAALDRETEEAWEEEARRYVRERAGEIGGPGDAISTRVDTTFHPARGILDAVADTDADLVAIGTHRESRLARAVLGSVADKVVRGVGVAVLVAHAEKT